jgi:Family of unknown function (DUF5719)
MTAAEKGSRRRAAGRVRPTVDRSVIGPVAVVLLALAAVLLTTSAEPVTRAGTAGLSRGALVDRTTFACPDLAAGRRATSTASLGLAPAPADLDVPSGGEVTQGPVASAGRPVDVRRGAVVDVPTTGGPAVSATGGAAAGLFGFRADQEDRRTLGVSACAAPRSQWWFTGAGAGLDHSSTLVLANVDPGPAVLDLVVLGPDGEVQTVGTHGVTLPPHTVRRVALADIAPQTDDLAVGVRTSRGRVVAAVDDTFSAKASGRPGQEWLAGTDLPSRTLRLAGLPATYGSARLLVANPSDLEAVVDVRVAGRSGIFTPEGLDPITVAPGTIEQLDLSDVLPKKEPVALRLRSRVPVVASVRVTDGGDHSYATPVAPLTGPAAAPVLRGAGSTLQLTAGPVATKAAVAAYAADGTRVGGTVLALDATATAVWSPGRKAAYVVVSPTTGTATGTATGQDSGTVHGAVTYGGRGIASVPLTPLPLQVVRPSVRPGLR